MPAKHEPLPLTELEARCDEELQRILHLHDEPVDRKRVRIRIAKETGMSVNVMRNLLRADGGAWRTSRIHDLHKSLHWQGIEPAHFYREAFPLPDASNPSSDSRPPTGSPTDPDPAHELKEARSHIALDQDSEGLLELDRLNIQPFLLEGEFCFFLAGKELERIAQIREEDKARGLESARAMTFENLPSVGASGLRRFDDGFHFLRYLAGVGSFASTYRLCGQYGNSAILLEHALSLVQGQKDTLAFADITMRTGATLRDLLHLKSAISQYANAHRVYTLCGSLEEATGAMFSEATTFHYMGDQLRALRLLKACAQLPANKRNRVAIRMALVNVSLALGKTQEAIKELDRIRRLELSGLQQAHATWLMACAHGRITPSRVDELFSRAFSQAREFLQPPDVLLVFADYCELNIATGEWSKVTRKALEICQADLPRLGNDPLTRAIVEEFLRRAMSAEMARSEIDKFRSRLKAIRSDRRPGQSRLLQDPS